MNFTENQRSSQVSGSTTVQVEGSGEDETVTVTIFGQRREQVEVSVLGVAVGARVVVNLEFPVLSTLPKHFN
jgi:hypothetical protein